MSALGYLLRDLEPEIFSSRYWGKRSLRVRGRGRSFDDLLERPWRETRDRAREHFGEYGDKTIRESLSSSQIDRALASGMTVISRFRDPALDAFARRLLAELGEARRHLFVLALESRHDRGICAHFDEYHVLVLQLEGRKRWRIGKTPLVENPSDGRRFIRGVCKLSDGRTVRSPKRMASMAVVLQPGDVLYVPPGTWHRARAVGSSMALSIIPDTRHTRTSDPHSRS